MLPQVTAQWADGTQQTTITNRYIRYYPVFSFKTSDFTSYLLPKSPIPFQQDQSRTVTGAIISQCIEEAIQELGQKKTKIKKSKSLHHFKVLQDKNFNYKQSCGLLVLSFKQYPFVVKLFMEKPTTIFDYHSTGLEPTFFFYMGGGSNRHLSGFTRLANRSFIAERIQHLKQWKHHLEMPRKWFWLPKQQNNIILAGKNIGTLDTVQTEIPSVYAIVADKIDFSDQTHLLTPQTKRQMIMQLCNDLEINIDPHAKNFAFVQDTISKQFKIILVDTEHFPTMVGITQKRHFRNHNEWYLYLASKCFCDIYLQTKRDLLIAGNNSVLSHYKKTTHELR